MQINVSIFFVFVEKLINNKLFMTILKICITLSIFFILFRKIDIHLVFNNLKNFSLFYLLINVILGVGLMQGFFVIRLHLFLKYNQIQSNIKELTKFHYISLFFQILLPSALGSDAVKVYYLRKRAKLIKVGLVVFITRVIGIFTLLLISFFTLVLFDIKLFDINLYINIEKMKKIIFLFLIMASFILLFKPFSYICNKIKMKAKILKYFSSVENTYNIKLILLTLLFSFIIHSITIFMTYFFFKGIGINLNLFKCFLYIPAVILFTFIIPTIYGMGVREYLLYHFFQQEVVNIENMFIITMAMMSVNFCLALTGGVVYFFKKRKEH